MTGIVQDVARGFRALWRHRGFSVLLIFTMAVGVGSLAAVFSVMGAVLLEPLPYPDVERLVSVQLSHLEHGANLLVGSDVFSAMDERARAMDELAAVIDLDLRLEVGEGTEQLKGAFATPSFFDLLGTEAALGELFAPTDGRKGAPPVAVITHELWRSRFSADQNLVGSALRFGGADLGGGSRDGKSELITIAGVLPPGFEAPFSKLDPQIWVAESFGPQSATGSPYALVFGRLRPGVEPTEAEADLQTIVADVERARDTRSQWRTQLVSLRDFISGKSRRPVELLFLGGLLVFLIASANTANLLVARAGGRLGEAAIRQAIGAGRSRILGQLVAEGLPAAMCSGAVGLVLAFGALELFRSRNMLGLPQRFDVSLDWRTGLVVLFLVMATGLLFGLAPALRFWRLSSTDAVAGIHTGNPAKTGRGRGRFALLSFQITVALAVTVACALLVESFLRIQRVDPGFEENSLLTAWLQTDDAYYVDPRVRATFHQRVLDRAESLPDAEAVGLVNDLPLSGRTGAMEFVVESPESQASNRSAVMQTRAISPGYPETMGIPLRSGRYLQEADLRSLSILVSQMAAQSLWGARDPLGQRLKLAGSERNPWMNVVGVVADVKDESLTRDPQPVVYVPLLQFSPMALVVRSRSGDMDRLVAALQDEVREVEPQQVLVDVQPMARRVEEDMTQARLAAWLMGALSLVGLLLAAVGVYGTVWYMVSERRRELGIRYAVGASPRGLLRAVAAKVIPWIAAGLVAGAASGMAVSRLMTALLYEVEPTSPRVLVTAVAVMAAVATAGAYFPARRAMRTDTASILRE